jgi:exodeoxyribonuclease-3
MLISSYNVNGIRAAQRKGFCEWVVKTQPDVICLQEIKADETQIPAEVLALGYHAYWHPAVKKGYSGVGILTRTVPDQVMTGIGTDWIDAEGRVLGVRLNGVEVYSIYAPSGTTGDIRQDMKYKFLDVFYDFAKQKLIDKTAEVVFCGDFNIAHREIDIHDPVSNKKSSGFLPEERAWMTRLMESGYVDVFRSLYPELSDAYSWWTYRSGAKGNNKGWRIDYHLASAGFAERAESGQMERELDMSDHVPVSIRYI